MRRRKFIQQSTLGMGTVLMANSVFSFGSNLPEYDVDKAYPFLWGSAYYRAPEPEPELWEADFKKMQGMGFNSVKFLLQWRWSHIREDEFYFDDIKKLLDLAYKYGIKVTLNLLYDVSPHWLFDKYPDAKQIMNNGSIVEPYVVGHRAIGGHPGPCYNHPGAKFERIKFLDNAIKDLKGYSALDMWDVWNEPELCFPQRNPIQVEKLVCYCSNCEKKFKEYVRKKYLTLSNLNDKWGRNYLNWNQVEMPRNTEAYLDFIDWREFHGHTMTEEAAWRINMIHEKDPARVAYLHVVPNTMNPFNAITTCTDDFEVAKLCDVFAATTLGPNFTTQVVSAARGKVCYNVECHINGGSTSTHQKIIGREALLRDFIPQLGLGIKGFLFWQFRPEILGREAPAWGLVNLDGTDREVTKAARDFWETIKPYTSALMKANPEVPPIGVWKSRKNEIFQYCVHNTLNPIIENVNGYVDALYWNSYPFRYLSGDMLEKEELDNLKILIMPSAYYLTEEEANAMVRWVRNGGILIAEAHLGGYNGTTGRHSRTLPGCGLAEAFGIKEEITTASFHLELEKAEAVTGDLNADTKKAMESIGVSGGKYYPIHQANGKIVWGALRYAELSGDNITIEGYFEKDKPCAVSKPVGKGFIYYYATRLGSGAIKDNEGLLELIDRAYQKGGVQRTLNASALENNMLRTDALKQNGQVQFLMIQSRSDKKLSVSLSEKGEYKGLFTGLRLALNGETELDLPPRFIDIFVKI